MTDQQPTERLAAWLNDRRWYGDKLREIETSAVAFAASDHLDHGTVALEVVRLTFAHGDDARYVLLRTSYDPLGDGLEFAAARTWILDGLAGGRNLAGEPAGALQWRATTAGAGVDWTAVAADSRVFRGEQSNTSVVYPDTAMLKLFRKLREGENPEVEIGAFLTERTAFRSFPRLLGTIVLQLDGLETTIAAVQEFIPSVGDAWSWITERVTDPDIRPATVEAARLLGERTAEMHVALASGSEADFAPELATATYANAVREDAFRELEDTLYQLERRGISGVDALGSGLTSALDGLVALDGTMITRMHGDYHLGQVLRTARDDFAILDFEGEPTRPLAERRAKASPLRDVAGMLRSFDYAAETARRASEGGASEIDAWSAAARAAFLDGYDTGVRDDAVLMHGWSAEGRAAALAALEAHKALYEVRYELSNRPDWLDIPLNALRRIASPDSG